jgi:foldase protein PrsA
LGRKRLALIVFGLVLACLFIGFAVAQGIGDPSVPSGDVAIVEGVPDEFDTVSEAELRRSIAQQAGQSGLKKPPKEGEEKYEELKTAALTELLDVVWVRGEAEEMGLSVTQKQIESELVQIKKTNFKAKGSYQKFLNESNFTQEDVNNRLEIQLLSTQIQEQITKGAAPASNSEIEAYYEAEQANQFTTPESRDVRVIINKDKSEVEKAKAALEKDSSPASWKKVAAKYSTDPTTKSKGGLQQGITEEFIKGELKKAIFDSPTNQLSGPVKYEGNYLLVEVVKLNAEKVSSLGEVKSQISSTLTKQKQEQAFSEFLANFQSKWTSQSFCAPGYTIETCANYVGTGHPSNATPSCYEANPKTPPTECPAPVVPISPALPGTVTPIKPKGEPFPQRPQPEPPPSTTGGAGTTVPEGTPPGSEPSGE